MNTTFSGNAHFISSPHKSGPVTKKKKEDSRRPDGTRQIIITERPSQEEIEAAKQAALACDPKRGGLSAYCPACRRHFYITNVFLSIRERGYCGSCQWFMSGEDDHVVSSRMPTLEEALTIPAGREGTMELAVIRYAAMKYRDEFISGGNDGTLE